MPRTAATSTYGSLLKIGNGATPTESFTTVAEVGDFQGPKLKTDTAEATNLGSPNAYIERIPVFKDGGTFTCTANFLPQNATQSYSSGVLHDFDNRTIRNYQIVFSDGGTTTWVMPLICTGFEVKGKLKDRLVVDLTYEMASAPTLA